MTETEEKKSKQPEIIIHRGEKLLARAPTLKKAKEVIGQIEAKEETVVNVHYDFKCYPLDGYVAINRALSEHFGYTEALREGFWGSRPPTKLSIKTGVDTEIQVYAGKLAPPAWEGGYIEMYVKPDKPMALGVTGQLKQKFEPSISELVKLAKKKVTAESIYRGRAIEADLNYIQAMRGGYHFDPVACAPEFIDVSGPPILILPRHIQRRMHMTLWDVIRNPDDFRYNGVPVKTGVMKSGPPGTGKTLSVLHTAKLAVESGWTCIKLTTPQFFVEGYNMAHFYAPCVFIIEDVEKIFGGPRSPFMDAILDRLDGIATKGSEVITICTSNHPEQINEAIRRSGRIGTHIRFDVLDGEAAGRFIKTYSDDYLAPDVDLTQVGRSFDGLVASDITEGISLAKKMAIGEFGREIKKKLTTEMLVDAGEIIRMDKGLYTGKGMSQEAFNLRIVQAAWWIQMGKEFPVDFEVAAQEFFSGRRSKKAEAKEVETITDQEE